MKNIAIVVAVVLPLLASANTSLENLGELSQQYTKECFKLTDQPNKNLTQLDKALKACELAQVYNRAHHALEGSEKAFNDLSWFCKGVELEGLDRRLLACDLAIAIGKKHLD